TVEQAVAFEVNLDERRTRRDGALDQRLRQGVLNISLQGPAQRTRTIAAVGKRLVQNPLLRFLIHRDGDVPLCEIGIELSNQQFQNLDEVRIRQSVKDDYFVQTVQELWIEGPLDFRLHHVLNLLRNKLFLVYLEAKALALHQVTRADVGRHDDAHVLEINRVAQTVRELSVFQHLQQDVEHIRVRLLDFVQQDNRVGRPLDAFGELSALFVAHVSRRRTDQLADRVLLHEFRHVEANERLLAAEEELRQSARNFRLADAGRAQEQERSDGAVRRFEASARATNRTGQSTDRLVLRDHALVQLFFHTQQLLCFFFLDGGDGYAGPAADHFLNVLALLALFVGVEACLLELVIRDGILHPVNDELDPLLDFRDLIRQGSLAQLYARAGFVQQVNCFVGQEAIRDVAVRVIHRELDSVIRVAYGMELLVALLDAVDDLYGFRLIRRRNLHGLEAAFQRAVFFNGLAVLTRRGCADALNFAAGKRGLENVGGIQRALG